jgi:hypothetical protein
MDARPDVPRKQPLYFINAPLDYLLVGGLSILAFCFICWKYGLHDPRIDPSVRTATDPVVLLGQRLLWVCNWPHFAATSYRLYHSRDNIKQYPLTALVIPWLIMAGVFGSVIYPDTIAPIFILSFLLWSPYHFSGQTVGVSLIYARRAGFQVGKVERLALSTFVFGTYLFTTIDSHTGTQPMSPYFGIPVYSLGLPAWMTVVSETTMYFAGLILLFSVVRWCLMNNRVLPPIVLLPAAAQFVWFVASRQWPTFNEFVPFFHSMQYLLIAWSMQLKEKMDVEQQRPHQPRTGPGQVLWAGATVAMAVLMFFYLPWPETLAVAYRALIIGAVFAVYAGASLQLDGRGVKPSKHYVLFETLRWWELNIFYGALLFFFFPLVLVKIWHVREALALGVTAAAVQIHHFFVDGVIWKLKRKTVASPLMVNIDELLRPAAGSVPAVIGVGTVPAVETVGQRV